MTVRGLRNTISQNMFFPSHQSIDAISHHHYMSEMVDATFHICFADLEMKLKVLRLDAKRGEK